ncbi:hypothetical protein ACH0AH_14520 [Microbacterium paludicola]|uniref:hypothetical protein n=1 Tax=Microbacterium paludicola TaxID=300019 RepID=UPI0038791DF8
MSRLVFGEYVRMGGDLHRVVSWRGETVKLQAVSSGAIHRVPRAELPAVITVHPTATYRKARVTILGYNDDDTVDIGVHNLTDAKRLKLPSVDASPGGMSVGTVKLSELSKIHEGIPGGE